MSEKAEREITPATQAKILKNGERIVCDCDGKLVTVMKCIQSTHRAVFVALDPPRAFEALDEPTSDEQLFIGGDNPDCTVDTVCKGGAKILKAQRVCAMEGLRAIAKTY